jgi:acetoin utilization protein AcuC
VSRLRFFFHPGAFEYDFGLHHPLKPQRLQRTLKLMQAVGLFENTPVEQPEPAAVTDLLRIHSPEYIAAVQSGSGDFGFGPGDNPAFAGMYEASIAYTGATIAASYAVLEGAPVAINISGGLHHALRDRVSGFCIFNDPAIACSILRDRFQRVAYVDIDLHHGDGVQWLFYDDPTVLTVSVHQDGRTLFPGTGSVREMGEGDAAGTSINIPLPPATTDRYWLSALEPTVRKAFDLFRPEAVVLQMGADAHFLDPLGNLQLTAQGWLEGVKLIKSFGLPTVAVGGGGYNLTTVPRIWTLACAEWLDVALPDDIPEPTAREIGAHHFFDREAPEGPDMTEYLGKLLRAIDEGPIKALRTRHG